MSPAVSPLFTALASYTRLTHLKLTNIAFPDPIVTPDSQWKGIPCIPSLRSLHLGQVTFLPAEDIADFILRCTADGCQFSNGSNSVSTCALEHIQLVDVYEESIWGPRLKMPRILAASMTQLVESGMCEEFVERELPGLVERLISVDVKTERIIGGDRLLPEFLLAIQ